MISYELAKELKEAGFPQTNNHTQKFLAVTGTPYFSSRPERTDDVLAPTLEELIEACGERLSWLGHTVGGNWRADGEGDDVSCVAFTPTEAVAMLWLALNKK